MARRCEICGKGPSFGYRISHSHRKTPRRWSPSLRKIRAIVDGSPRKINVCTKCLKAGKVVRA
ncbi:MAG: 50S ribosomal protein L28 [Actinomycetota bacterium]